MAIPEIHAWVLQYGTPVWEREVVYSASQISREDALKEVRWHQKHDAMDRASRGLLFAAGLLDSPWRCKATEMMFQVATDIPEGLPNRGLYLHYEGASEYVPIRPGSVIFTVKRPLWPTLAKPEGRPAGRSRLMGNYKLVGTSSLATPRRDPRWKELQRASGFRPYQFNRELKEEGFISRHSNGVLGMSEEESGKWVRLA